MITDTKSGTTTNYAADSAFVMAQAEVIHGGVHYYEAPAGASAAEIFEVGVRQLNGGMPENARESIGKAVMDGGLTGNKVCFHWQLALVSGRTRQEVPEQDITTLRQVPQTCNMAGTDDWADGARIICRLLESVERPDEDLRPLLKDLDALADLQKSMILRHLQLFLDGPLKNEMWRRALDGARKNRLANCRAERVWKFFEPAPAGTRLREPQPPDVPIATRVQALAATAILITAGTHIAHLLVKELRVVALLAYLLSVGGGYAAARAGTEWRFRLERLRAKEREYSAYQRRPQNAPSGGFAHKVDQRLDHYFARYVPRDASRATWMAETAGIRKIIRDEIVDIYREQRTGVDRIIWLIRYRVSDVRRRWENGTLWDYRRELDTPPATKVKTILGLTALGLGMALVLEDAVRVDPPSAIRSAVFALAAGAIAGRAWLRIVLERRRYKADSAETERTRRARPCVHRDPRLPR